MNKTKVKPEPGIGATMGVGSDAYAMTISRVSDSLKTVWAKRDDSLLTSGNERDGSATYVHSPNDEAGEVKFTLRNDGTYRQVGGTRYLAIGYRRAYRDPHF